jgi:hypothetical protein
MLLSTATALLAFLPAAAANVSSVDAPAQPTTLSLDQDTEGDARGTVVVWHHATTGRPTAHLQGYLRDDYGNVFAHIVARLEDWGGVSGYAVTKYGYHKVDGEWYFDTYDKEGWFELEFDYGYHNEIEVEGHFEGYRDRWYSEWFLEYED